MNPAPLKDQTDYTKDLFKDLNGDAIDETRRAGIQ